MKLSLILITLILPFVVFSADNPGIAKRPLQDIHKDLLFIENKGQIVDQHNRQRPDIDFKIETGAITIFIGDGQLHYQWNKPSAQQVMQISTPGDVSTATDIYRLDVQLIGADPNAEMITLNRTPYYENYYLPACPNGATAHSFGKIIYRNIYPGIDWVIYTQTEGTGEHAKLKYDFIVHPGGDVTKIKLQYNGAASLILEKGALIATTPFGSITEQAPYTYDAVTNEALPSAFILNENTLSFNTNGRKDNMVIDPSLSWATYYGGGKDDRGYTVNVDHNGNAVFCGVTQSTSNIATTGSYATTLSSFQDGFIAKFSSSGNILWATYYGGNGSDDIRAAAIDNNDNIAIGGTTQSTAGIATTGAYNSTSNINNTYIARFSSAGILLWGTYFIVRVSGYIYVATDAANNVYAASHTNTSGLATSGTHQFSPAGGTDVILMKFSTSGALQWSTYYGGLGLENLLDMTIDINDNILLAGVTSSTTGVATAGAYQATIGGAAGGCGFIAKFNTSGIRQWGTYYGTVGYTHFNDVVADKYGNIYFAADTGSVNGTDLKLGKFNSQGSALIWDKFLPSALQSNTSNLAVYGNSLAVSNSNNLYFVNHPIVSSSKDTIKYACTHQSGTSFAQSYTDIRCTVFDSAGTQLWSTFYGGECEDYFFDVAAGNNNDLYLAGYTCSFTHIATSGSYQSSLTNQPPSPALDAYLAKFSIDTVALIDELFADSLLCAGDTFQLHYGAINGFKAGNVFTVLLSDASGSFTSPYTIGSTTSVTGGYIQCIIPLGIPTGNQYRLRIAASNPSKTSCDNGVDIKISSGPPVKPIITAINPVCLGDTISMTANTSTTGIVYYWKGPDNYSASGQTISLPNSVPTMAGRYIVKAYLVGCYKADTVNIVLNPKPSKPVSGNNDTICSGGTIQLSATCATPGVNYTWAGPSSFNSATQNPSIPNATASRSGDYIVKAILNGCYRQDTTYILVKQSPAKPKGGSNSPLCSGKTLNLTASGSSANNWTWTGPSSYSSPQQNSTITGVPLTAAGTYIVRVDSSNGCYGTDTIAVTINLTPNTPTAGSNSPVCIGGQLNLTASGVTAGAGFVWTGPGYTSGLQNPSIQPVLTGNAGNYTVYSNLNGCQSATSSTIVSVVSGASVAIYPNPNDTICDGNGVSFSTIPNNGGSTPAYQWYKNGNSISGANSKSYAASGIINNDAFYVTMLASGSSCNTSIASNVINITVIPNTTNLAATATVDPAGPVWAGLQLKFTANVTGCNGDLTYQWMQDGKPIPNATTNLWSSTRLSNKVNISCMVKCHACAVPDTVLTNTIALDVSTAVQDHNALKDLNIYPNPTEGRFIVSGYYTDATADMEIIDPLGRTVAVYHTRSANNLLQQEINISILPVGLYILRLSDEQGNSVTKKIVKE